MDKMRKLYFKFQFTKEGSCMVQSGKARFSTIHLVMIALFVALTAVCAQITIPIGAVPVSLSLLPVLLCAVLLPLKDAVWAMVAYMLIGLAGAPVFSGLQGGPAKLFGVTGGYILGYIPCVALTAWLVKIWKDRFLMNCLAMALGVLACYGFGTVWFMAVQHVDFMKGLSLCVLPFLPFDAGKIILAAVLALRLRPILQRMVPGLE